MIVANMNNPDDEAFENLITSLKAEKDTPRPVGQLRPKRLFHVASGEVVVAEGEKKYAIVSYIWNPDKLPKYPRRRRRDSATLRTQKDGDPTDGGKYYFGVPIHNVSAKDRPQPRPETCLLDESNVDWEYSTEDFDEVVRLACDEKAIDSRWLVEDDSEFSTKAQQINVPAFAWAESERQAAYVAEVLRLASVEAQRRNFEYVWMDFLCINQSDPEDKAEQVPLMADYYRNAEVCIVISEMLRRRYSHRIYCLRPDILDQDHELPWELPGPKRTDEEYRHWQIVFQQTDGLFWGEIERVYQGQFDDVVGNGYEKVAGYTEEERRYRVRWGLQDEIVGWILGFHEMRVWTFQESLLTTKDVVHVGGNIRINTLAALVMEEYYLEHQAEEAKHLPCEWLPDYRKYVRLIYLRSQYLKGTQYRFPLPNWKLSELSIRNRPTDEPEWSENLCMSIIQDQKRESFNELDKIYGILGLFKPSIRSAFPVRYDISLSAAFTILIYLRIRDGDLHAFLFDENRSMAPHSISSTPSWLPSRYASMMLRDAREKMLLYRPVEVSGGSSITVRGRKLHLISPFLHIGERDMPPRLPEPSPESELLCPDEFNITPYNPTWSDDKKLPRYTDPDVIQFSPRGRPKFPKCTLIEPITFSAVSYDQRKEFWDRSHAEEIIASRWKLFEAVKKGWAVMVNFAGNPEHMLWLLLVSEDEGKTWVKVGQTKTGKILRGFEEDIGRWVMEFVII